MGLFDLLHVKITVKKIKNNIVSYLNTNFIVANSI